MCKNKKLQKTLQEAFEPNTMLSQRLAELTELEELLAQKERLLQENNSLDKKISIVKGEILEEAKEIPGLRK